MFLLVTFLLARFLFKKIFGAANRVPAIAMEPVTTNAVPAITMEPAATNAAPAPVAAPAPAPNPTTLMDLPTNILVDIWYTLPCVQVNQMRTVSSDFNRLGKLVLFKKAKLIIDIATALILRTWDEEKVFLDRYVEDTNDMLEMAFDFLERRYIVLERYSQNEMNETLGCVFDAEVMDELLAIFYDQLEALDNGDRDSFVDFNRMAYNVNAMMNM